MKLFACIWGEGGGVDGIAGLGRRERLKGKREGKRRGGKRVGKRGGGRVRI